MPDIFTSQSNKTKKSPTLANPKPHASKKSHITTGEPSLFCSFKKNPSGLKFAHQENGEKIILFTRRHFATNFPWIAIAILATILYPLGSLLWQFGGVNLPKIPLEFSIATTIFYYSVIIGYSLFSFATWFYNIGIITQKRILDIDFEHLSYIDVAITQLPEIEDVVYRQKGFFASFFNYGDVVAHTVPNKEEFVFEKIPKPTQVVEMLSKLIAD